MGMLKDQLPVRHSKGTRYTHAGFDLAFTWNAGILGQSSKSLGHTQNTGISRNDVSWVPAILLGSLITSQAHRTRRLPFHNPQSQRQRSCHAGLLKSSRWFTCQAHLNKKCVLLTIVMMLVPDLRYDLFRPLRI